MNNPTCDFCRSEIPSIQGIAQQVRLTIAFEHPPNTPADRIRSNEYRRTFEVCFRCELQLELSATRNDLEHRFSRWLQNEPGAMKRDETATRLNNLEGILGSLDTFAHDVEKKTQRLAARSNDAEEALVALQGQIRSLTNEVKKRGHK